MEYGMTKRQRDVVTFVRTFTDKNGYSPSFQEIADACGWGSKPNVSRVMGQLRERGMVSMLPNRSRSVRVVESAE